MTPEENHRKKRYTAYAVMILGVLVFIVGTAVLSNVILTVAGLLTLFAGFIRKAVVDRRYREEVNQITDTPEIDFSAMKHRHTDDDRTDNDKFKGDN